MGPAYDSGPPDVSFVVPVFNQARIIRRNLSSLILNAHSTFELILIDDNSSDGSFEQIMGFIRSPELKRCPLWTKVVVIRFRRQRFETMSDHVGIKRSSAKYIIEIQADMEILEDAFDNKLILALTSDPKLFVVSGRGVMNFADVASSYARLKGSEASIGKSFVKALFRLLYQSLLPASINASTHSSAITSDVRNVSLCDEITRFNLTGEAGRLGPAIEYLPSTEQTESNLVFIGETVMRGPIIFERIRYLQLGGFNLKAFYLGFDEHDLILRAATEKFWKAGYICIGFSAPMRDGSIRQERSLGTKIRIATESRRIRRKMHLSALARFSTIYRGSNWQREILRLETNPKDVKTYE